MPPHSEAHKRAISEAHKARLAAMSAEELAAWKEKVRNPKKVPDKDGMIWCRLCLAYKPAELFTRKKTEPLCNICWAEYNAVAQIKSKYGLTKEQYEALGDSCWLCGTEEVLSPRLSPGRRKMAFRLHVDHSHKTGKVRGKICHNCNAGIGYFKDDPNLLKLAARYIEDTERE